MNFFVLVVVVIGFSLIYYGYEKKKDYEVKLRELDIQEKKIDLEIMRAESKVKEDNN
ncbi:hypothetical protein QTG56_22435 (plasmid) [Rossellomorea sp. AcN35-11]|nr:hypothetical protein [Rossellomorea aquimaris]WJV32132.1 hypothetical protein QTG56_22435 [Rossellomorea sp. AcN35-11]